MGLQFFKKEIPTQVFSCEIYDIFKKNFFLQNTSGGYFFLWVVLFPLIKLFFSET